MWSCQWWASLRTTTVKLMKYIFEESFQGIQVAVASPRSLPNAKLLKGRVVVLDLAFAHSKPSGRYPSITHKLIDQLGDRLALFLDHHDSEFHKDLKIKSASSWQRKLSMGHVQK